MEGPIHRQSFIASTIRKRIEHSLQTRALAPGDRLPSTREIGKELKADPRVVMAAYQKLAEEGLVVMRPRSGAFIAPASYLPGEEPAPPKDFLTDVLVSGVVRGFTLRSFTDNLHLSAFGRQLRAAVFAGTEDQVHGLCREIKADYGLQTTPVLATTLRRGLRDARSVERSHLLLTTKTLGAEVSRLGEKLRKPVIVVDVRPTVLGEEWRTLFRAGRVYLVATDPGFLTVVRGYLGPALDTANVKMLIVGKDDLAVIPPHGPTYVTESARLKLGKMRIPGRLIAPARLLSENCVRAIIDFIVTANATQPG